MTPTTPLSFDGLGIAPKLLEVLDTNHFVVPTPIQHQSIPTALQGKDIIGIAQTGTGKTMAFGIPMIQRLAIYKGLGLVVLPTRELALQVDESLNKIGKPVGLKTAILIGGENIQKQVRQLKAKPHILIATPGRLIDHLEQKTVQLGQVNILVLDEADRMLDMGFAPQIKKIMQALPAKRQTMLFSATMPAEIVQMAKSYMQLPVRVEVAPAGSTVHTVTQELFFVHKENKLQLLQKLLGEYTGSVLVFSRTKYGAKKITRALQRMGHTAAEIHSNRSLSQRLEALSGFKLGRYRVLVATDIAARGIDVTGIELVINFDLPEQPEDYVHRIGRTGRAEHTGHAVSFATPEQKFDVRAIERLIKKQLPVSQLPQLPEAAAIPEEVERRGFGRGRFPARHSSPRPRGRFSAAPGGRRGAPGSSRLKRNFTAPADKKPSARRTHKNFRNAPRQMFYGTNVQRHSRGNADDSLF